MNKTQLINDTILLLEFNDKLINHFIKVKETNEAADFFGVVKPTADEIKTVIDRWKLVVLEWIKEEKPKYFHPNQIENTYENVMAVSVQAFFPDTREKRFMELIRSNKYIFEAILQLLEEQK